MSAAADATHAIYASLVSDTAPKSNDGLPPGLSRGLIGQIGDRAVGYTIVVDPRMQDLDLLRRRLYEGLNPETRPAAQIVASCESAARLADAWSALARRDWYPSGLNLGYAVTLRPGTEKIVLTIDVEAAGSDVVEAVHRIAPSLVVIEDGEAGRLM